MYVDPEKVVTSTIVLGASEVVCAGSGEVVAGLGIGGPPTGPAKVLADNRRSDNALYDLGYGIMDTNRSKHKYV